MSRTKTLAQLRSAVENQADIVGASARYSATLVNGLINQSIQRFRERISTEGVTRYLAPTSGTISAGVASGFPFQTLDLSAVSPSVVRVFGVDITIGSQIVTLEHRGFEERAKYGSQPSTPIAWTEYGTAHIAILPAPQSAHSYTVWYLPVLDDLASDAATFDGVAGWEDYVVWDVFQRLITRDTYAKLFEQATITKDGIWADIIRGATKVTSAGGTHLGRDTFGAIGLAGTAVRKVPASAGGGLPSNGSITNALLANMVARTIKGNFTYGNASPQDLTGAQVADILPTFAGGAGGLVPTGAGNPALFLTNAGSWVAPSVGGSVSGVAFSQLQDMPGPRVLGNFGPTGPAVPLLGQQVASMIAVFTGSAHGLVPFPSGGAQGFVLDDSGKWVTQGGGSATGISNAQMLAMPPFTFKARITGGSGLPENISVGQAATMLPNFQGGGSGQGRGLVTAPTGGVAGNFLRDDGSWQAPAGGAATGISNAMLLAMPPLSLKGNFGSSSGAAADLDKQQAASLMPNFFQASGAGRGFVFAPTGGAVGNFLRDDGSFQQVTSGGGGPTMLAAAPEGAVQFNGGSGFAGATGFTFSATGLTLSRNLTLPTGWIGFGSNPATGGDLRHSNNSVLMRAGLAQGSGSAQLLRFTNLDQFVIGDSVTQGEFHQVADGVPYSFKHGATENARLDSLHLGLNPGLRLGLQQLALPDPIGDKLGTWTASGFANIATGINVTGSGMMLSVGSGGPQLHASGIDLRNGDIRNVRRLNGLDGIRLYGDLPDSDSNVTEPSGTAWIIPLSTTASRIFSIVPSGTEHGKTVLIENRSAFSHSIYNTGTGMGAPSGWIATLAPSGGMSARFASGAWEFGNKYQLGGF